MEVGPGQERVVVEHLLEVRDGPGRVGRVAREAPAELVVDPARGHRRERVARHRRLPAAQQELDDGGGGELRWAAPAAVRAVEVRAQPLLRGLERRGIERVGGRPKQRAADEPRGELLAHRADLAALPGPGAGDRPEHLWPARRAVPRLRREVGAAVEGRLVRGEEDVERPAALARHGLHGFHGDRVDVRALLPVHLHADEVLVHERRDLRILEALALHDVAPVAGGVADGHQERPILLARPRERLGPPGQPVHGVPRVLEQVRRGLPGQRVGHGGYRTAARMRFPRATAWASVKPP